MIYRNNVVSDQQYKYFIAKVMQLHQSNEAEFVVFASINNEEGYGFAIQFQMPMEVFGVVVFEPSSRGIDGMVEDWVLSTDRLLFKDCSSISLVGDEAFEDKRFPEAKFLLLGSNFSSYVQTSRDLLYKKGVLNILDVLHQLDTDVIAKGRIAMPKRDYADLTVGVLELINKAFIVDGRLEYQKNTFDIGFLLGYGNKKLGLAHYGVLLEEYIGQGRVFGISPLLYRPDIIEAFSIKRLIHDASNYLQGKMGMVEFSSTKNKSLNGSCLFSLPPENQTLQIIPNKLSSYYASDGGYYLILDGDKYSNDFNSIAFDLMGVAVKSITSFSYRTVSEVNSQEASESGEYQSLKAFYLNSLAERSLLNYHYQYDQLLSIDDNVDFYLRATNEAKDHIVHRFMVDEIILQVSDDEIITLRGVSYIHHITNILRSRLR
jgi:hypothetical protein